MLIHHSFDQRFVTNMEKLRKEYGDEIFDLTGIGDKSLDINRYSADFFGSDAATADKTIDGNANVSDTSVNAWEAELKKPIMKLNALYQLWKSAERKHGIKRANKLIEAEVRGAIRIHDCHLWNKSYCYAYSLNNLVNEGMPFYNKIKIGPVKHFDSYINLTLQFLCYASNQIAGAVAFPDFLIYAEYFIRKDYGENWYEDEKIVDKINQLFQNWIYSVNFSWRSNQSAFTNVSVFDKEWLKALFAEHTNPDFSLPDLDNTMRVQKMFVNEMNRNLKDNPFTFPVMTACLLYDKEKQDFSDQEFFEWVSEVNAETGLFNIFHDSDINSLSSCCFIGDETIEVFNNKTGLTELHTMKGFVELFIKESYNAIKIDPKYSINSYNYETSQNEITQITGVLKKKNDNKLLIHIILDDNRSIKVTHDHIIKVYDNNIKNMIDISACKLLDDPDRYLLHVE